MPDGGIFMDILPRLDGGALDSVIRDITSKFSSLSDDMARSVGKDFGSGASSAAQRMAAQIETSMRTAQSSVERSMEAMTRAQDGLATRTDTLRLSQLKAQAQVEKWGETSIQAQTALAKVDAEQRKVEASARAVERAQRDSQAAHAGLAEASRGAAAAHDAHASSLAKVGAAATNASAALGVGMVAAGAYGLDQAAKMQQKMTLLQTSAGESAKNINMLQDAVYSLSNKWGYSVSDIQDSLRTVEQAGYHGKDAVKMLTGAVQEAHTEMAPLNDVTHVLTTTTADFGKSIDQVNDSASKQVATISQSKATLGEYAASMGAVENSAQNAHVSMSQLNAAWAEMTRHGLTGQVASDYLTNSINKLSAPNPAMITALGQYGITPQQLQATLADKGANGGLAGADEMISRSILAHQGPNGQILLNSFNQSSQNAQAAEEMYGAMSPQAQALAQQYETHGGSLFKLKQGLNATGQAQLSQWASMYDKSQGFNQLLKAGQPGAQSYMGAMYKAFGGDSVAERTALNLTGSNYGDYQGIQNVVNNAQTAADGTVMGANESNSTLESKLANEKQSIKNTLTQFGALGLGPMTKFVSAMQDATNWLHQHTGVLKSLLVGGGVVGGIGVGTKILNGAGNLFGADHLGGRIVGGALKYGIGKPAQYAAKGVLGAARGIGNVASSAGDWWDWTGKAKVGNAASRVGGAVGRGASAVGRAGSAVGGKLASGAQIAGDMAGSAWDVTKLGAKAAGRGIKSAAGAAKDLGASGVSKAASGLKSAGGFVADFGKTAAGAALDLGKLLKTQAISGFISAWNGIKTAVQAVKDFQIASKLAAAATKAWTIAQAAFDAVCDANPIVLVVAGIVALGAAIYEAYKHSQTFRDIVADVWNWIKQLAGVIADIAIKAFQDLTTGVKDVWSKFGDVKQIVADVWNGFKTFGQWIDDAFTTTWHALGDVFKTVMDGIRQGFKDAVTDIKGAWDILSKVVGTPVYFIAEYVYKDGIEKLWNGVAGAFGLDSMKLPDVPTDKIPHYAGGGIFPGYAPGQDTVNAKVSPGEGIAVPELVQAIGPERFMALNSYYSGGRKPGSGPAPHFAGGGFISDIVGGAEDLGKDVVNGAKHVVNAAIDVGKFMMDPIGSIHRLFDKYIDKAKGTPNGPGDKTSGWFQTVAGMPKRFLDAALNWGKSMLGMGGGSGGGSEKWASGAGAQQWAPIIVQALAAEGFPTTAPYVQATEAQIMTESGGNPNIIQQVHDVNWPNNLARGLVQVTPGTARGLGLSQLGGNIYDPLTNLRLGMRELKSQHGGNLLGTWGHGHGYSGGGIVPGAPSKVDKYQQDAQKALDAAAKYDAEAQKYLAEAAQQPGSGAAAAQKHLQLAAKDRGLAAKAQALAATTTGAVRQKHLDAAARYTDDANKAQAAAAKAQTGAVTSVQKYQTLAKKAQENAQKKRDEAAQYKQKAQAAGSGTPTAPGASISGSSASAGADQTSGLMTPEQFGEKLGGTLMDGLLEETSIGNSGFDALLADPNNSLFGRIAGAGMSVKFGKPYLTQLNAPPKPTTATPSQPTPTVEQPKSARTHTSPVHVKQAPMVHIENQHIHNGDHQKANRDIVRQLNAYAPASGR
ncbi:phage tail tape measure protein [Rhodococcus sp. D2-41]|uniref:phage tail tape measure protein n=1 Tax=Speluncibacter jeojiensis TaxID=2710754 RepID=UPI0024100420|nr:phage tail tape measure protein [Rhodococcus sp. D2-41]MDG3012372.1 phage tail tape measure protein [Rhodococcus sp. D2-41]